MPTRMMTCCTCMCCVLVDEPVAGSVVRGRRRAYAGWLCQGEAADGEVYCFAHFFCYDLFEFLREVFA